MPLNANCIWEVRTDGNDNNGGAFRSGAAGTDYSQQAAAQKSGTNLTMHPTINTRVQPVGAGVAAADVGNVINITAGTAWTTGWYEITAQDGTYWTLDRSPAAAGSANTGTYAMGGALASPGRLGQALNDTTNSGISGMRAYIRSGTYTLTSTTANVSGGRVSLPNQRMYLIEGYQTTRGDLGTPPEINAGTLTSFTIFSTNGFVGNGQQFIVNLQFNGNNRTGVVGYTNATYANKTYRCIAINCPGDGFTGLAGAVECRASNCGNGFTPAAGYLLNCIANNNTNDGFAGTSAGGAVINCISYSNGRHGFLFPNFTNTAINCTAHGNTADGFVSTAYGSATLVNCIATNNGGIGFNLVTGSPDNFYLNCAGRNNTTNNMDTSPAPFFNRGFITPTADPYQNAAGADFRLNSTAGGGAALRGQGSIIPAQTDYRDIGAVQTTPGSDGGQIIGNQSILIG